MPIHILKMVCTSHESVDGHGFFEALFIIALKLSMQYMPKLALKPSGIREQVHNAESAVNMVKAELESGGVKHFPDCRYLDGKDKLLYPEPRDVFPCDLIHSDHCRPPTSYH